jgi:hypothetical protein
LVQDIYEMSRIEVLYETFWSRFPSMPHEKYYRVPYITEEDF